MLKAANGQHQTNHTYFIYNSTNLYNIFVPKMQEKSYYIVFLVFFSLRRGTPLLSAFCERYAKGYIGKISQFWNIYKEKQKKINNNYNGKIVRHYIFTIALVLQYSQFASRTGTEKLRIHKYFIWLWSVWIWSVSLSVFGEFIIEVCSSVR